MRANVNEAANVSLSVGLECMHSCLQMDHKATIPCSGRMYDRETNHSLNLEIIIALVGLEFA